MTPTPETTTDWLTQLAQYAQTVPGGATMFTVAMFLVVLSVLVFFHELGHYAAARSVGIRVLAFSIGFGKEIFGWTDKAGTRWKIGWLPLGGYVQMKGQEDLKPILASKESDSFAAKTIGQRAWVIAAGPLANIVLAFVLLVAVMLTGEHRLKPEVGTVMSDMPANGFLIPGDTILRTDGIAVTEWNDVQTYVADHPNIPVRLDVLRNGQPTTVTLTPKSTTFTDLLGDTHHVGRIGVTPSYGTNVTQHPPAQAITRAAYRTWELTALTVKSLYKLMIGAISPDNLTGPLGIADMTGQAASSGTFALLMFMVVISINLGIVNMFPLPVLDGGHLVFLALEKLRGKPLSALTQEWAMRVGLTLIVMLALFSTLNDTKRLGWVGDTEAPTETPAP
jgi:regulator of sigma E protease